LPPTCTDPDERRDRDELAWALRIGQKSKRFLASLNEPLRRTLLRILTSPSEVRADAIGRLHARDDGADLTELLIELEEKEWARQWFVERLRGG
jgi:hypothetical protein